MSARAPGRLRVAMALYGDITYDSRVQREAASLADAGHAVTVLCLSGKAPPEAPFRVLTWTPDGVAVLPDGSSPFLREAPTSMARLIRARVAWAVGYARTVRRWGRWAVRAAGEVDVWHAHDLPGLMAIGPSVRPGTPLVYDSHEIFLETGTSARLPGPVRRMLGAYEGRLARRAIALVTVNDGYAEVLRRRLRPRRVLIVRNCPPRWTEPPGAGSPLRDAAAIPAGRPVLLYHGGFSADRGIEQVAEALLVPALASAHLVLLGYGPARTALEDLARDPRFGGRLHVVDAVPPGELLKWVAGADADVIPLQRSTLNHWLCTPNKLWESIAAGVPVVVSDFPGMRPIVLDDPTGPLGRVCDPSSPASIAAAVGEILALDPAQREQLRARSRQAAHERWNWETESARLVDLYAEIANTA